MWFGAGLATLLVTAAAAEASEKKDQTKEAEKPAEKVSEGSSSEEDTGEEIPCDFVEKMDHYERLGVKKGASAADIKKASDSRLFPHSLSLWRLPLITRLPPFHLAARIERLGAVPAREQVSQDESHLPPGQEQRQGQGLCAEELHGQRQGLFRETVLNPVCWVEVGGVGVVGVGCTG